MDRSTSLIAALACLAAGVACSEEAPSPAAQSNRAKAPQPSPSATSSPTVPANPAEIKSNPTPVAPNEKFHLDDETLAGPAVRPSGPPKRGKSLELMLRSTPSGADAAVDGIVVGRTPTLWKMPADQSPHEFTFVLPGFSVARYRFAPTHSGVVHGKLTRLRARKKE